MNHLRPDIRQAQAHDLEALVAFQCAMAQETEGLTLDPKTVGLGVNAVLNGSQTGRYLVAVSNQKLIASLLLLDEWSDWRNGIVWWIHSVYVVPEFRGQGIFKYLYAYVKNEAQRAPHIRGLRLYVEKTNHPAQTVYKKLGMTKEHYDLFEWMKTF